MKRVLLTGFEPFEDGKVNPSWLAVRRLHGRVIRGHQIVARKLPTAFGRSLAELRRHVRRIRPALVICVGQAGGRAEITPERVALNLEDAHIPDNAGRQPREGPVVPDGPAAYWSALPVRAIVRALKRRGIPAAVSLSAGTFVCNHVFYGLMHELAVQKAAGRDRGGTRARPRPPAPRGGFIHLPFLPAQAARHHDQPSLPLERMVEALAVAVKVSL
jgi:pyroglutamyl-peptidase